jgi:hypothetical protein
VTPRLLPSRLKEPGHRRADARGLGDDVTIEKIIATVLDEAHRRQVEELMDTLQEGLEGCTSGLLTDPGLGHKAPTSVLLLVFRSALPWDRLLDFLIVEFVAIWYVSLRNGEKSAAAR